MAFLDKGASGTMHRQWGKQIGATLKAHEKHNYLLSDTARALIAKERADLDLKLVRLDGSVTGYRAFVENAFIEVRANQRVADFLVDTAQTNAKAAVLPVKAEVDAVLPAGAVSIWSGQPLSRILRAGRQATIRFGNMTASKVRSLPGKDMFAFKEVIASAIEKGTALLESFVAEERDQIEPKRLPLRSAMEGDIFALRDFLTKMNGRLLQELSQAFVDSLYPDLRPDQKAMGEPIDEEVDAASPPPAPPAEPT